MLVEITIVVIGFFVSFILFCFLEEFFVEIKFIARK
jgi:hypothetical protein